MNGPEDKDEKTRRGEQARKVGRQERHLTMLNDHLDSKDLFAGTQNIVIVHGRETYYLRVTAQNKLILTK